MFTYWLLLKKQTVDSAGILMKRLGQRYVQYVNRRYKRSGTLWEGRFRSCIIQEERYLLLCQRYIEMNPVRAGLVQYPGEYRLSSYACNGQGVKTDLITPHPLYKNLGRTNHERRQAYRALFRYELEAGEIDKIRKATTGNFACGDNRFNEEIAEMFGRRVNAWKGRETEEGVKLVQYVIPLTY